jgi:hypothetical protein
VPPGGDVTFDTNGPIVGFTHTPGTAQIIVSSAGTYAVMFSVTGTAAGQFTLFDNSTPIAGSDYSSGTDLQDNGQVIIGLGAGDVLTLRNTSAVSIPLPLGATNASILIMRVA